MSVQVVLDALSAAPSVSAAEAVEVTLPSPLRSATSVAAAVHARLAAAIGRGDAPEVERVHIQFIVSGAGARGIGTCECAANALSCNVLSIFLFVSFVMNIQIRLTVPSALAYLYT